MFRLAAAFFSSGAKRQRNDDGGDEVPYTQLKQYQEESAELQRRLGINSLPRRDGAAASTCHGDHNDVWIFRSSVSLVVRASGLVVVTNSAIHTHNDF